MTHLILAFCVFSLLIALTLAEPFNEENDAEISAFLHQYKALPAKDKWDYREKLAAVCYRLVAGISDSNERTAILKLVSSPNKLDGDELHTRIHAYMKGRLSDEGYAKWEKSWRFCEPIFAEAGSTYAFVLRYDQMGEALISAHFTKEEQEFWRNDVMGGSSSGSQLPNQLI